MTPDPAARQTIIHLVPHTHWDREWYRPFQSFRMQLVDLVDRVLDMLEADPAFTFTLDGQLATIDDYLEIRPEQAERLKGHVMGGRLAIGPWQILMDEFLVSGETLVRNLEMGRARAADFGEPMPVGYLPDMFGHVAQMPQILSRAGLADAVVWRGVPSAIDRHAFRWESPDGSSVRAEYLPLGYGNAAGMFAVPDRLDVAADRFLEWARPWFGTDPVLAMYGTDHTAPVPELAGLVSRLNEVHAASNMRISTLAQYVAGAPALTADDPCWRGEMRSGARANVLMGVTSARIDIKRAAGRAETLLERYAEPLSALHLVPDAWPAPFLSLAWRRVVENSAHDSICGCSVDAVSAQVLVRYAEAQQIGGSLARRAVAAIAAAVPRGALTIVNPSPAARSGMVEAELLIPATWESVALELPDGTRLGTQELSRKEPILFDQELRGDEVDDLFRRFHGREIFDHAWNGYRIDERTITFEVDTDPEPAWLDVDGLRADVVATLRAAPDARWRVMIVARPRRRVAASVPAPPLGWNAVRAVEGHVTPAGAVRVSADASTITNGLLTVAVAGDGTLRVESSDGTVTTGVGRIVDGGDYGDSYNYGPPASDAVVDIPCAVTGTSDLAGPVRGRITVRRRFEWPSDVQQGGAARTTETEETEVDMDVELRADEPFVRIGLRFVNRSDAHRVRFHVPLPRSADASHAEGQFAVVERGMNVEGGHREQPVATYPAHGWVDAGGIAVLVPHVSEYELADAPDAASGRELAVTILRSIGLISRNANPYRQDPAGPELPIPQAQMRGPWRFDLALYPHAGDWRQGGVAPAAERYRHEFFAAPGSAGGDGAWPPAGAGRDGLRLDGANVTLSSLRRGREGWLEARVVNLSGDRRGASLGGGIRQARDVDLQGDAGATLPIGGNGTVNLELGPYEIRTVQLRRREESRARPDLLDAGGPRQVG